MPKSSRLPQATQPKVVAGIPCFNTELFIRDIIFKAKKYVNQVIVIDYSLPLPPLPEEAALS